MGIVVEIANAGGGASRLAEASGDRRVEHTRALARAYAEVFRDADVLLLQEAAREVRAEHHGRIRDIAFRDAGQADFLSMLADELKDMQQEFRFFFAPVILSNRDSHPDKWQRMRVPKGVVRGQGYAIGLRSDTASPLNFWTGEVDAFAEPVELRLPLLEGQTLYLGNRLSEPRLAHIVRARVAGEDLTLANVHLGTLPREREGDDAVDKVGQALRARQLAEVLSAREAHLRGGKKCATQQSRWLIGGDFNCPPPTLAASVPANAFRIVFGTTDGRTRPPVHEPETGAFVSERPSTDNLLLEDGFNRPPTEATILRDDHATLGSAIQYLVSSGMDHYVLHVRL